MMTYCPGVEYPYSSWRQAVMKTDLKMQNRCVSGRRREDGRLSLFVHARYSIR